MVFALGKRGSCNVSVSSRFRSAARSTSPFILFHTPPFHFGAHAERIKKVDQILDKSETIADVDILNTRFLHKLLLLSLHVSKCLPEEAPRKMSDRSKTREGKTCAAWESSKNRFQIFAD